MKSKITWTALFLFALAGVILLTGVSCSGGSAASENQAAASGAEADNGYESARIRLAHVQAVDHFINHAAEAWGKKISETTGGKVRVEVYPAESIGSEREVVDGIVAGTGVDFWLGSTSPFTNHYARLTFYEGPYLFESRAQLQKFYASDFVQKTLNAELAEHCKVQSLGMIYFGTRHVTSNKLAKTPAEFKGLKIRAPATEIFMDSVAAMGAAATPILFSETYLALQQGVVDGEENPPAAIRAMKFDEVQKYLILTGHMVQPNQFLLSEFTRAKISPELLDLLYKTSAEISTEYNKIAYDIEDNLLKELGQKMEIVEVDQALFKKAMDPLYAKYVGIWGQDILDAIAAAK